MVNGVILVPFHAGDLRLQRGDPRIELGDRHRIEILLRQQGHRITGPGGRRDVIGIHDAKR